MGDEREHAVHERDPVDARLIEEGRFDELVAAYFYVIRQRCAARVRNPADADDVAQGVVVRLLHQLNRGKGFSAPFRVVVHMRIGWEIKDYFARQKRDQQRTVALEDVDEPWAEDDSNLAILDRDEVQRLLAQLPHADREILERVYIDAVPIAQAAEQLGISRNAADARLFRARQKLREVVDG